MILAIPAEILILIVVLLIIVLAIVAFFFYLASRKVANPNDEERMKTLD